MAEKEIKKIKLLIAVFLTLTCFAIVNNNWSYGSSNKIPQLTLSELTDSNRGKTFTFLGTVKSIDKVKNDRHSLKINSPDNAFIIESTIWPSIGSYPDLYRGNSIRITGALEKYKDSWQLNPLSSEHIEPDGNNQKLNLTDLSKAIKLIGKDLYIGPVIGYKTIIHRSKAGNKNLKILVHNGEDFAEGIMWENTWDEVAIEILEQKCPVYIDAKVTKYSGNISLQVKDIIKLDDTYESSIGSLKSLFTNLEDAIYKIGETLIIGPVFSKGSELFESKNGSQHLKFQVKNNGLSVSGIIWQGKWDNVTRDIFDTQNPLYLKAKITTYNSAPSLELDWVIAE